MHPKSMFVCNSDALLGIQLEGEFSGLKGKPKKHQPRFTIVVTRPV